MYNAVVITLWGICDISTLLASMKKMKNTKLLVMKKPEMKKPENQILG